MHPEQLPAMKGPFCLSSHSISAPHPFSHLPVLSFVQSLLHSTQLLFVLSNPIILLFNILMHSVFEHSLGSDVSNCDDVKNEVRPQN